HAGARALRKPAADADRDCPAGKGRHGAAIWATADPARLRSFQAFMSSPDPAPVIDLIEAFRRSKVMFAAVKLGVFDRLECGPADAAALAVEVDARTEALERLLDACVGLG